MKKYLFILALLPLFLMSCAPRIIVPSATQKVVYIKKAPASHKIVVVKGKRYYRWNGKYHRKTRHGYVVVHL
jgi:hypothetical protein